MSDWDLNANSRREQILSGRDISYTKVLIPAILDQLPTADESWRRLLDCGCGTGFFSKAVSDLGWAVTAVDSSVRMVELAQQDYGGSTSLTFLNATVEEFAKDATDQFDVAVANMFLAGVGELPPVSRAVFNVLRPGGMFVVADIHPLFWRMYKGQDRLDYWQTHVLRQPFTISLEEETPLPVPTTVVYRPLQDLVGALLDTGFSLRSLKEPRPDREVEKQYPAPWRYPRFIVLNLTKNQN